jgi:hypothetical protein
MLRLTATLATDGPCRDGTRARPAALASALHERWDEGTPFHVSHDLHRPIGWVLPAAVYFEPGRTRLCGGTVIPESTEEQAWVNANARAYWERRNRGHASDFAELYRELGEHATVGAKETIAECVAVHEGGIAERVFPKLFAQRDKDGLVPISALKPIAPGVYVLGALVVFAHPYFRRSLSPMNTLNYAFLGMLESLDPSVHPHVALDPDMVGLASTFRPSIEHVYGWGPLFDADLAAIDPGLTVYTATDRERFFNGVSRTEFFWYSRKDEHILEAEELRDQRTFALSGLEYGCRYAHSIVSETTGRAVHLDGAVRFYDEDQIIERLGMQIRHVERDKPYKKLWRVGRRAGAVGKADDAPLDVVTWKGLLSAYYRDNQQVGEYLGGRDALGASRPDASSRVEYAETDLPARLSLAGPRVMMSFRPPPATGAERTVVPLKALDDGDVPVVEFPTVELVKRMRDAGHQVAFDPGTALIVTEDPGFNLPLVWHRSSDLVPATIEAIRVMCLCMLERGESAQVSLAVGFPLAEAGLIVSIVGTSTDLLRLLDAWHELQPHLQTAGTLAEVISQKLRGWPSTSDRPEDLGAAIARGSLEVKRVDVPPERLEPTDERRRLALLISSADEPDLRDQLERGELMFCLGGLVRVATCTTCKGSYASCPCGIPPAGPPAQVMEVGPMTAHLSTSRRR